MSETARLAFPAVTARCVRMRGVQPDPRYGYSLWSFEVRDGDGPDLARAGTTSASSAAPGKEAKYATDGDSATRWAVSTSDRPRTDSWLAVALGATRRFDRVRPSCEAAAGRKYRIETSPDGIAWTLIATCPAPALHSTGGWLDIDGRAGIVVTSPNPLAVTNDHVTLSAGPPAPLLAELYPGRSDLPMLAQRGSRHASTRVSRTISSCWQTFPARPRPKPLPCPRIAPRCCCTEARGADRRPSAHRHAATWPHRAGHLRRNPALPAERRRPQSRDFPGRTAAARDDQPGRSRRRRPGDSVAARPGRRDGDRPRRAAGGRNRRTLLDGRTRTRHRRRDQHWGITHTEAALPDRNRTVSVALTRPVRYLAVRTLDWRPGDAGLTRVSALTPPN